MAAYYLGLDFGGTKTEALIADESGRAVGFGRSGPGNHQEVGFGGMALALFEATRQACAAAGIAIEQIAGAGFGIAGYDWPSQRPIMLEIIEQTLALTAPHEVVNDTIMGLWAGAEAGWGVSLIAGTSANCRGRDQQGREGRMMGDSVLFGEYGGAEEVVSEAINAVAAAWSRRGPPTRLTEALIAYHEARSVDDLLEGLALGRYSRGGELAPLVFQLAAAGDEVARGVADWAGRELGSLAVGVIRQLNFEQIGFDVVLVGGMFGAGALLLDPLTATIHAVAPGARLQRLTNPPVIGSVLLGMDAAGFDFGLARASLAQTTRELLQSLGNQP